MCCAITLKSAYQRTKLKAIQSSYVKFVTQIWSENIFEKHLVNSLESREKIKKNLGSFSTQN